MTRWVLAMMMVGVIGCSRQEPGQPAAAAPAGASATTPGATTAVKLALNWVPEPEFGGFYAAQEAGEYKKRNLDVEIIAGGAGLPTVQMLASGKVPFAVVSADEVIINRVRGGDVVAIFTVYQDCPQGIMTHAQKGFKNLTDVFANEGTIAMEPGLPYTKFLEGKYGFDKVKVVPYAGGVAQFLNDPNLSQQCFVTSEPLAAKRQGADVKTFLVAESGYNPYTAVVATNGAYLKEHPDAVKAFVAATRAGWEAYVKDPAPSNAVMGKLNTGMSAEDFAAAAEAQKPLLESDTTKAHGLGAMTTERWQTLGDQLVKLGVIDKAPPAGECFVPAE